jgi:hypothetical protein
VSSSSRRHARMLPLALVTIVVLLGGCTGRQVVKSYSSSVKREFVYGCTTGGEAKTDGRSVRSDTKDPAEKKQIEEAKKQMKAKVPHIEAICNCTYDTLQKNVHFKDLKKITDDLEQSPDQLPPELTKISQSCADKSSGTS